MRQHERGYSLIEVLVAMAIMGSVFLSIVSLFYLGRRTVYSGKQMTQAVAVGTHVLEDLAQLTMSGVYNAFVVNNATTLGDYTIGGVTYDDVIIRSTSANVVASPPADIGAENDPAPADAAINGFLTTWRNEITQVNNTKFQDGSVTLIMKPTDPEAPNPITQLLDAQNQPVATVLQIRAIVQWREATRQRSVVLDTTKLRRP